MQAKYQIKLFDNKLISFECNYSVTWFDANTNKYDDYKIKIQIYVGSKYIIKYKDGYITSRQEVIAEETNRYFHDALRKNTKGIKPARQNNGINEYESSKHTIFLRKLLFKINNKKLKLQDFKVIKWW